MVISDNSSDHSQKKSAMLHQVKKKAEEKTVEERHCMACTFMISKVLPEKCIK